MYLLVNYSQIQQTKMVHYKPVPEPKPPGSAGRLIFHTNVNTYIKHTIGVLPTQNFNE